MAHDEGQKRIEAMFAELKELAELNIVVDPNRAYNDGHVCLFLSISRHTLWRIRSKGEELQPTELMPGAAARTRGSTIIAFLDARERATNVIDFTATGRRRKTA
jgi:hypothetical protein